MTRSLLLVLALTMVLAVAAPVSAAANAKHDNNGKKHGTTTPPPIVEPPIVAPPPAPAPAPSPSPAPIVVTVPDASPAPVVPASWLPPTAAPVGRGVALADAAGPTAPQPAAPSRAAPSPSAPSPPPSKEDRRDERLAAYMIASSIVPTRNVAPSFDGAATSLATLVAPSAGAPAWAWALPVMGLVSASALVATIHTLRRRPPVALAAEAPAVTLRVVGSDIRSLLEAGRDAIKAERIDEALAWFTQATLVEPTLHVAHYCRGVCLSTLGRYQDAFDALAKAHAIEPTEAAYRLDMARAGARVGKHREAMSAIAPVLQAMPDLIESVTLDEAFASLGDHPRWLAMTGRL